MRNSIVISTNFEQRLAEKASGVTALAMQTSSDAHPRLLFTRNLDEQQQIDLSNDVVPLQSNWR